MINKFQCPGCINGSSVETCKSYDKYTIDQGVVSCSNWYPGTTLLGIGKIALGLPKGFNRTGDSDLKIPYRCYIRLHEKFNRLWWDKFDIPTWAIEQDNFLIVRTYQPRLNNTFVDIIQNGKIKDLPDFVVDVSKFIKEID